MPTKRRKPLKPLMVKCSDEQRATLDAAANDAGLPVSTWVRMVALKAAKK